MTANKYHITNTAATPAMKIASLQEWLLFSSKIHIRVSII